MAINQTVVDLIQKAAETVGSEAELARALGMPQSDISGWKSGHKGCTAADRARLAGFAKEDAVQELVRATLEKYEGTKRGEQLRQVLGKWLHQTGAASGGVLQSLASAIFLTLALLAPPPAQASTYSTMYIMLND